MKLEWMSDFHHAHMVAVTAANIAPRLIFLFPKRSRQQALDVVATFVCPRRRKCVTCAWCVGDKVRVNVGLVQRTLPVEVQRVGSAETAAPASANGLPQGTGV